MFTGHKHTQETKKRISEAKKGKKLTSEHCRHISESMKGNRNALGYKHKPEAKEKMKGNQYALGYKHTPEEIQKQSEALINHEKLSKIVGQFDLNGNLLEVFPSTHQVQRDLGYNHGRISEACRGIRKTYKGYIWRYA